MTLLLQLHNHQSLDSQVMSDDQKWDSMFKQVVECKVENGIFFSAILQAAADYIDIHDKNGWIPKDTPERPKLGLWAHDIRNEKRKGKLSQSKQLALESIGFQWEEEKPSTTLSMEEEFAKMLQVTSDCIRAQGHGWISEQTPKFPTLGEWARNMRRQKRRGKLSRSQWLALDKTGFVWEHPLSYASRNFETMLQVAAEYIQIKGHNGFVPIHTPHFPKLGFWARNQRFQKRLGKLSTSKQKALERIGFAWQVPTF